jgi:uncharacterized membrane protein
MAVTTVERAGRLWPVAAFTASYMLTATLGAVLTSNVEFAFYIAIMALLVGLVAVVHRAIALTSAQLWALSVWGLAHMAGGLLPVPQSWPIDGEIRVLYSFWLVPGMLKYDHVVHAYGFGVATWVCWHGIRAALRARGADAAPTAGLMILAASSGMGLGAANELVEFAATLLVPETNVGGYMNTGFDLVANACGAATAAVVIALTYSSRPRPPSGSA